MIAVEKRGENAKEEGFCRMKRRLELPSSGQVVFCCLRWDYSRLYFEVLSAIPKTGELDRECSKRHGSEHPLW